MNEKNLIEEVRKYPCIWEVSKKSYRDAKSQKERLKTSGS